MVAGNVISHSVRAAAASNLRLPPMPTIRDLVKMYRLRAQKQLSQNFLMDENLTNKIVRAAGNMKDFYICEVGPGPGGITRSILNAGAKKVILIEKDTRFNSTLDMLSHYAPGKVETYFGDVLSFNLSRLFPEEERKAWDDVVPSIRIIGNLPFSVSTPLIIRWLRDISNRANAWSYGRATLALTFQQEVAERLVAEASYDQRSRLSIMAQYLCQVHHKFTIPGTAFVPKPDVNVSVVKFIPRKVPLINQPFDLVEKVVRQTFHGRQKICFHGIKTLFPEVIRDQLANYMIESAEVNRETRSFQLTIDEFSRLCDSYARICEKHPDIRDYNYRGPKLENEWDESFSDSIDNIRAEVDAAKNNYKSNVIILDEDSALGIGGTK